MVGTTGDGQGVILDTQKGKKQVEQPTYDGEVLEDQIFNQKEEDRPVMVEDDALKTQKSFEASSESDVKQEQESQSSSDSEEAQEIKPK